MSESDDVVDEQTGEYTPAGENQGTDRTFTSREVAEAFGVEEQRVVNAFQGEYNLGADGRISSAQAQELAEIFLGDQPLDQQEAALMQLGAYTPRADDVEASATPKAPGEESDKLRPSQDSYKRPYN